MAQVRLLVPWTDKDGKHHASDEVVSVDDATYATLRADGKASAVAEEKAAEDRAKEGNYQARTGRAEAAHEPKEDTKKK